MPGPIGKKRPVKKKQVAFRRKRTRVGVVYKCQCCKKYDAMYSVDTTGQIIFGNEICCYCKDTYEVVMQRRREDVMIEYLIRKGHISQ